MKKYLVGIMTIAFILGSIYSAQAVEKWETVGTYQVPDSQSKISVNVNKSISSIKFRINNASVYVYSVSIIGNNNQNLPVNQTFAAGSSIEQPLGGDIFVSKLECVAKDDGQNATVRVDIKFNDANAGNNNNNNNNNSNPPVNPPVVVNPPVNPSVNPQPIYGWDILATHDSPDYRAQVSTVVNRRIAGIKLMAFNAPVTIFRISYDGDGRPNTIDVNRVIAVGQEFSQDFFTPVMVGTIRIDMADYGKNGFVYTYGKNAQNTSTNNGQYQSFGQLDVRRNLKSLVVNINQNITHIRLQVQNQVYVNAIKANVNGYDQVVAQGLTLNPGTNNIPSVLSGSTVRFLTFEIRTTNTTSSNVTVYAMASNNGGYYQPDNMVIRHFQANNASHAMQQFGQYLRVTDYEEERNAANALRDQLDQMGINEGIKRQILRSISARNFVVFRVQYRSEYILCWFI